MKNIGQEKLNILNSTVASLVTESLFILVAFRRCDFVTRLKGNVRDGVGGLSIFSRNGDSKKFHGMGRLTKDSEVKFENIVLTFLQSVIALAHQFIVGADVKYVNQHLGDLLTNKWQRPCKYIHKVWKPIRMWWTVKLSYVHYIVFIF